MKTKTLHWKHRLIDFGILRAIYISFLTILLSQVTIAQTVHTVDNRPESGAMYTSLQTAINTAVAGDIIQIHPSPTSYGNIAFNKTLTLVGVGHNPTNANGIKSTVLNITLSGITTNSIIQGLHITGVIQAPSTTNSVGMHIVNNRLDRYISGYQWDGRTNDWVIEGNYFTSAGVNFYGYAGANWQISNNWIRGTFSTLVNTTVIINNIIVNSSTSGKPSFFSSCNSPIVANNIFLFTSLATGVGLTSSTVNFQNCMTYSYTGTTLDPLGDGSGGNIDNTDPLFTSVPVNSITDFYNNDYSLTAGSAGKGAGTDTTDLGIYGRLFDFDPNGRPDLTPYPTDINITNTVIAPGQSLNVEFKAAIKQ